MEALARQFDRLKPAGCLPGAVRSALAHAASGLNRPLAGAVLRRGPAHALEDLCAHMTRLWSDDEKKRFWRGVRVRSTDELIRGWYRDCESPDPIDQMQQVYVRSWLVDDLLMKADKMSMAASLELRCPFLDHELVEWCARLPLVWKIGSRRLGYSSKRILREYARKRLPGEIITRPKRGFPVPAYKWLEQDLAKWAGERITSGRLEPWVEVEAIAPILQAAKRGSHSAQHQVWNLIVLDHWLEAWT